jgi:type VI protein secretion system component VasF
MTTPDSVLAALAALPSEDPAPELSARLRAAARARLMPRRVHPVWSLLVVVTVVVYLGCAVHFSGSLYLR